jgi:hypothetical protein
VSEKIAFYQIVAKKSPLKGHTPRKPASKSSTGRKTPTKSATKIPKQDVYILKLKTEAIALINDPKDRKALPKHKTAIKKMIVDDILGEFKILSYKADPKMETITIKLIWRKPYGLDQAPREFFTGF